MNKRSLPLPASFIILLASWLFYSTPSPSTTSPLPNGPTTPTPTSIPSLSTPTLTLTHTPTPTPTPIPTVAPACVPSWVSVTSGTSAILRGIAAVAENDAWVVGDNTILHWDGSAWNPIPHPIPSDIDGPNQILAIAAESDDDIWASGTYSDGSNAHSTAYHWDGLAWSLVYTSTPTRFNALTGITTIGEADAIIVGLQDPDQPPTIYRCDLQYSCTSFIHPIPAGSLYAVDSNHIGDIWAVGVGADNSSLVAHYNITTWEVMPVPNIGRLTGVNTFSSGEVLAVSEVGGSLYWDGTTWQVITLPLNARAISNTDFSSVARIDTWAVGSSKAKDQPNIFRWDPTHTQWVGMATPDSPPVQLQAVAGRFINDAWAVGGQGIIYRYRFPNSSLFAQQFEDAPSNSTFYSHIQRLTCLSVITGYPCGSPSEPCGPNNLPYYRPASLVTRGQLAKIVVIASNLDPYTGSETFEDVPSGSTFHPYIQALYARGAITGYPCGSPNEPCNPPLNRPYFRPNANATRGQLTKVIAITARFFDPLETQTFEDVPPSSTFHLYVENMATRNIINGYPCGGPGEPCVPPTNRPYFRLAPNVTRGQMAKIAANTYFP